MIVNYQNGAKLIDKYQANTLRLVTPLPRSSATAASKRVLDRPRCRPGELPVTVRVVPGAEASVVLAAQARQLGITTELWARLVVDSGHVLAALECGAAATRSALITALDQSAETPRDTAVSLISETTAAYVRALRSHRGGPVPAPELELLIPEDIAGAWRLAATAEGSRFDQWLQRSLARHPQGAVLDWEIAAATQHLSLREWCYAAWASR